MKTTIGIDVGISTTKIVGVRDEEVSSPLRIRATDPVTSLYGAFGKYLYDNQIDLNDIEQVMLTGVQPTSTRPSTDSPRPRWRSLSLTGWEPSTNRN